MRLPRWFAISEKMYRFSRTVVGSWYIYRYFTGYNIDPTPGDWPAEPKQICVIESLSKCNRFE